MISCEFTVDSKPVPWSTPDIGMSKGRRFAKKNPALTAWQLLVAKEAREAYGPIEPHLGCIYLELCFQFKHADPLKWGSIVRPKLEWIEDQGRFKKSTGGMADRTNLIKGVEDALQGVFFVNDTQVRCGKDSCVWGETDRVYVVVGFID